MTTVVDARSRNVAQAARKLPGYAVKHYVDTLASDPEALRGSFEAYRALDTTIAQNQARKTPAADPARAGNQRSGRHR